MLTGTGTDKIPKDIYQIAKYIVDTYEQQQKAEAEAAKASVSGP